MKEETLFRRHVVDRFLRTLPVTFFVSVQQLAIVGTPDKLGCIHGYFVALELKSRTNEPTAMQSFIMDQFVKAGGVALVVRPENWTQVRELLWKLAHGKITPKELPPWRSLL